MTMTKEQLQALLRGHLDNLIDYAFDFNSESVKLIAKDENEQTQAIFVFAMGGLAQAVEQEVERLENGTPSGSNILPASD